MRLRHSSTPIRCVVQPCCDSWLIFCCSSGAGARKHSSAAQGRPLSCPSLDPWHGAALQLDNDAVCDLLIEAGARAPAPACTSHSAGETLAIARIVLSSARQSRLSAEAGWAASRDRKGPPSKADRIRRTGTKRRTRSASEGLRGAAAGLEGRAAHPAPPGKGPTEKNCGGLTTHARGRSRMAETA